MSSRFYDKISDSNTAKITIFENAFSTRLGSAETRSFTSLEDLEEYLGEELTLVEDKRHIPLFARGECVGRRLKENLKPPFLVILDVDKSRTPIGVLSERLELFGVDHVAHTTYSHGLDGTNSYRVFVDYVARDWDELRDVTEQLFELACLPATHESHNSPCFFAPASHPDRRREFEIVSAINGGSTWEPEWHEPTERDRPEPHRDASDVDEAEVRAALAFIPNHQREVWIEVGMALHSTGAEWARDAWDDWSRSRDYPDYSDDEQETRWRSFRDGATTIATVFHLGREHGWRPAEERDDPEDDFADEIEEARDRGLTPRARAMRDLNERYAYVAMGRGAIIDLEDKDRGAEFKSVSAFLLAHQHPRVATGRLTAGGAPVMAPCGKVWLEDFPERRSFDRVDFLPPGGPEKLRDGVLNLWRGWGVEPRPESCELFLAHVRDVICDGDEERYRWVVAWMAHLVQRPWEKPGTCIVMRSNEGSGKGLFANALVRLCGSHGCQVTEPSQLTGRFNQHLANKVLIFADEVTWGGRRQEEGVLKGRITEQNQIVEPKGIDAFTTRSYARYLIASNNDWVVPAGVSARRYTVLDVSEALIGKRRYFQAVVDELDGGGLEGLLSYLQGLDLSEWPDPRQALKTEALRDQKIESLDSMDQWLLSVLVSGQFNQYQESWEKRVLTSDVYDSYLDSARTLGIPRKSAEIQVTTRLKKILGGRYRTSRTTETIDGRRVTRRYLALPALPRLRALFEEYLQSPIEWEHEDLLGD